MLEIKNVSKSFPGVKALDQVSLAFQPGEVHAIVGENGAGKSTLIKVICGIYSPDEGEVRLNNRAANPKIIQRRPGAENQPGEPGNPGYPQKHHCRKYYA